jgi:hypothetical protein
MERIYFDNAATTAIDPVVLEAMMPYLTEKFGNPSSIYSYGRESRLAIESGRKSVARLLNAQRSFLLPVERKVRILRSPLPFATWVAPISLPPRSSTMLLYIQ